MDGSEFTDSICLNPQYKVKPERHPGGQKTTRRLIKLAGIEPCRILDMGAGSGVTLKLLKELDFDASGIDLEPGEGVDRGDILRTGFPDGSFEALISECAFFISGDGCGALSEANRLLRRGGKLLLSDIFYGDEEDFYKFILTGGFKLLSCVDITDEWKHYYIERIWDGTADKFCKLKHDDYCPKKFRYFLSVSERM
ncbi:MAG TPA: class I SAM-dependent methyltransferase [Clostridiaceae bacterium]|nr:class I SAM-dependent methyltransferase [Clostridiaceae bacterium]